MKREVIEKLLSQYAGDDIAGYLAAELDRVEKIRKAVSAIERRVRESQERYEAEQSALDRELVVIQAGCRHLETTHHGDPSGNNDSYRDCDHCGKSL